jgi:hypothetical protein
MSTIRLRDLYLKKELATLLVLIVVKILISVKAILFKKKKKKSLPEPSTNLMNINGQNLSIM